MLLFLLIPNYVYYVYAIQNFFQKKVNLLINLRIIGGTVSQKLSILLSSGIRQVTCMCRSQVWS